MSQIIYVTTYVPFDERKCVVCQKLEDEYHFVLECSLYSELRKKFISKYYWKNPSMFKFIEFLNSTIRVVFVGYAVSVFKLLNYEPNCCIKADNDIQYNLWPLSYIYSTFVCSEKLGGQLLS